MTSQPDVPAEWTRLHPFSPVINVGRTLGVVLVVLVPRIIAEGGHLVGLAFEAGILLLGVVAGFVSWLVTRWRVAGSELQIETGLVRRQSLRLPLARVQAIDLDRPLLARLVGLAAVRVQVAGSGAGRGKLAYLREDEAVRVRAQLLALSHGLHGTTPAPPGRPVYTVDNRRLVLSTLLGFPVIVLVVLIVGAVVIAVVEGSAAGVVPLLPALLAIGTLLWRRLNAEFNLTASEAPDGLRVDGGLLGTRHETVPLPRVQALRWDEPLLWRPWRWVRLELDVAQQRSARGDDAELFPDRALVPVAEVPAASAVLARVLPGADPDAVRGTRPPTRGRILAPLSHPNLGLAVGEQYLVCSSGFLRRRRVIVPLAKVQSLRLEQGPVSRLLRLATIHVDLVGRGWHAAARLRDAEEAEAWWPVIAERARLARQAQPTPLTSSSTARPPAARVQE